MNTDVMIDIIDVQYTKQYFCRKCVLIEENSSGIDLLHLTQYWVLALMMLNISNHSVRLLADDFLGPQDRSNGF